MNTVPSMNAPEDSGPEIPALAAILCLFLTALGTTFVARVSQNTALLASLIGATVAGLSVVLWAWARVARKRQSVRIVWHPKATHLAQGVAHVLVYAYWATYHPPLRDQFWLILAQIPFAYFLDIAFAWIRYGTYRMGFAPLPIVGSINLFLWMTDDWFAIQFLMVALAYISREWVVRKAEEISRHIFNPSALALVLVSLTLLLVRRSPYPWARVPSASNPSCWRGWSFSVCFPWCGPPWARLFLSWSSTLYGAVSPVAPIS